MLDKILKSLSPERISEILMRLPEDSLYLKYVNQLVKDASLDNKSYAALIGLGNNMNEFYQIKHQSKEMVENILFQLIQWENTAENRTLKYSVLSKYYFAKANHDLGKTYLKKVVAQEHNDAFLGYQLDLMNGLFLDLTNNYSDENLALVEKHEALNNNFHEQTKDYIALAKKLHRLVDPARSSKLHVSTSLLKELHEINQILDKLPMDAAIFKLEYRFAEIYISKNKKVEKEFVDFYIQLYEKWKKEDFFSEKNHDLKLKSIVNISFLLLTNKHIELSKIYLDEMQVEYLRFNKTFKPTHEIYHVSFSSYYYHLQEDFGKAQELLSNYEKQIVKLPLQLQTKYFYYQLYARSSFYDNNFNKAIDIIALINQATYKTIVNPPRKMHWSIFEFICHYQIHNYQYCKNIIQRLRGVLRKSGSKALKDCEIRYFKVMLKILNTMLKNVGYLENIETEALSELMKEEIRNPLFYDKIIDVEACLLAIKQNASSN